MQYNNFDKGLFQIVKLKPIYSINNEKNQLKREGVNDGNSVVILNEWMRKKIGYS